LNHRWGDSATRILETNGPTVEEGDESEGCVNLCVFQQDLSGIVAAKETNGNEVEELYLDVDKSERRS
jgi:hypothetical protein